MRELEDDSKVSFQNLIEYFNEHVPMYERPDMDRIKGDLLLQLLFRNRVADRRIVNEFLNGTYEETRPRWQQLLQLVRSEIQKGQPN